MIKSYREEAKGYADAGIKPAKVQVELELPDELAEALQTDPELADTFERLTPGRRKSGLTIVMVNRVVPAAENGTWHRT